MKKVYTNESIALVGMSKAYLLERGIDCIIRNEFGSSVMGEVAFFEVWPELWVLNEQDYANAMILIEGLQQQATIDGPEWDCQQCKETNPGNFGVCWQCGAERP